MLLDFQYKSLMHHEKNFNFLGNFFYNKKSNFLNGDGEQQSLKAKKMVWKFR